MIWPFLFSREKNFIDQLLLYIKKIYFSFKNILPQNRARFSFFFFFFIFSFRFTLIFSQYSFLLPLVVQYIFLLSFLAVSLYPCVQSQHKLRHKVDDYASFLQFRSQFVGIVVLRDSIPLLTSWPYQVFSSTPTPQFRHPCAAFTVCKFTCIHTSFNLSNIHTSYFTRGEQYTKYILLWLIRQIFIVLLINLK